MRSWLVGVTVLLCACAGLQTRPNTLVEQEVPYGENDAVASRHEVNGTVLYVETYGQGEPILLIHGNGQSIAAMKNQIAHFSMTNKVIAVDSRGHGRTPVGGDSLTYELIASDFAELLQQLDLGPLNIVGWSDGGIVGLLLASSHPEAVKKLAIMGANLNPGGAHDWALTLVARWRAEVESKMSDGDDSKDWSLILQRLALLEFQPDIDEESLRKITAPTLVMAGDKDVIRNEHTLQIFEHIPNAHLAIFPGATHMIPTQQPEIFNAFVERFFLEAYSRPTTRKIFEGDS